MVFSVIESLCYLLLPIHLSMLYIELLESTPGMHVVQLFSDEYIFFVLQTYP